MQDTVWGLTLRGLQAGSVLHDARRPDGATPPYSFPAPCARLVGLDPTSAGRPGSDGRGCLRFGGCGTSWRSGVGWTLGAPVCRGSSLMAEPWVALLLYGGTVLDDLTRLRSRGIRRLFGWARVPDPTTFGRWLRRAGGGLVPVLDDLIWHLVRVRWAACRRHRHFPALGTSSFTHLIY
jgi:hypothetical protein